MSKSRKAMLAFACALAMAMMCMLAACGSAATPQDDQAAIKSDVEKAIGTEVSTEELKAELESDDEIRGYAEYGLDVEAVAENLSKRYSVEVKDIQLDGDKANVVLAVSVPTFGSEMQQLVTDEVEKLDFTGMNEDEAMRATIKVLNDIFLRPDYPTDSQDITVKYVKKGGTWSMESPDTVNKQLRAAMGLE